MNSRESSLVGYQFKTDKDREDRDKDCRSDDVYYSCYRELLIYGDFYGGILYANWNLLKRLCLCIHIHQS